MKKLLCTLIAVSLLTGGSLAAFAMEEDIPEESEALEEVLSKEESEAVIDENDEVIFGDEQAPVFVELANPRRVSLYAPENYDNKNLPVNNELVYDDDGYITGRTIINTTGATATNSGLRFKTNTYQYGSRRWKNCFTYEFDFKVDRLDKQFIITLGAAKIKFAKDSATEQYYISYEGTSVGISHKMSIIWGHKPDTLLQYGDTYHLRIDMDSTAGGKVYTTFSDPETGYVYSSNAANGLSYTKEGYINDKSMYTFNFSSVSPLTITTSNERLYYDEYFMISNDIEAADSTVTASASMMNAVNNAKDTNDRTVPYLFLGVYDKNGAMVKNAIKDKAYIPNQTSADDEYLTAKVEYSTQADVSDLEDGEYTVKNFIWRDGQEMIVCTENVQKIITVHDGKITEVR
ncbi:MAG: hypothetical protein PUF72_03375 [Clostridiales bacterium]|nr:hypothetical protein [Clostridiales bacterium]